MNLEREVRQIVRNAREAYRRGEITLEKYLDATRIPLKDFYLKKIHDQRKRKKRKP